MRLIDADALKKSMAEAIKDAPLYIQATVDQYIDEAPTFTPLNEPLSIEQLREMDEPVWVACKPIEGGKGYWCLCRRGHIITPAGSIFDVKEIPHWVFYRRPPEGEANA